MEKFYLLFQEDILYKGDFHKYFFLHNYNWSHSGTQELLKKQKKNGLNKQTNK